MKLFKRSDSFLAEAGLFYAVAIWGSTFFIVKGAVTSIDPIVLIGYRFALAALIVGAVLLYKRKKLFHNAKRGFILAVLLWSVFVPQTFGLAYTTASNAGFLTGLFIVFVPLFNMLFYRKKPTLPAMISVALAVAGLWVLTGGLTSFNFGDFLIVVSAITTAIQILIIDNYVKKDDADPTVLSFQQFFFVGLISIVIALVLQLPLAVASSDVMWTILFLTIFPTLLAYVVRMHAQKRTSPLRVSLIFTLEPVFAALFAWWLGGEVFTIASAIGGLMIVAAMAVSELPTDKLRKLLRLPPATA